jgi:CHAT domain-containing protein
LLNAGLALAGANKRFDRAAQAPEEDGLLMAEEVAGLDLDGVDWLVLSACDTGIGELSRGDGVLGLRRAFRIAGAKTIVMSLWKVGDEATADWMNSLYDARLSGLSTAESVRRASLGMLENLRRQGRPALPSDWAGFIAVGDWR